MKTNVLLLIDCQKDFTMPGYSLYVEGADKDMIRLSNFIKENSQQIDKIIYTLDLHQKIDISHPKFWKDSNGNYPQPFTKITYEEILEGKWMPIYFEEESKKYVKQLEEQGEFPHFIWPEHCIIGSVGSSMNSSIMSELKYWCKNNNKSFEAIIKGTNPLSEHFGVFHSQIIFPEFIETHINTKLLNQLDEYENVIIAGEAKSHCVATSIKQIMNLSESITKKLIILEDCMSDIEELSHLGDPIYNKAKNLGVKFEKSNNLIL